jgi:hypothetical protein
MSGLGQTYLVPGSDISSLPGPFTLLSVDFSWVTHRAFTSCFLALMSCTHSCSVLFLEGNGSWWWASFEASSGCRCFLKWSLYKAQETCQETKTQQLSGGVLPRGLSTSWWYSRLDWVLKIVSSRDPHQSEDHELQQRGSHEYDASLQQALL